MAIRDLAVAYNGSANADSALNFTVQMCRKHGAHLTGLHVHRPLEFSPLIRKMTSDEVLAHMRKADSDSVGTVEASFRQNLSTLGFDGPADWIVEEGDANEHLCRFARYFDLMVMGQAYDAEGKKNRIRPEDLVLRSGRPLLLVTVDYDVHAFAEYAVVAWDGSRPAARALADAMQILETKKRLDIVTVGSTRKTEEREMAPGRDLVVHLRRHGVDARRITLEADREGVGASILAYCVEQNPDVLVMGAYTHTRLREDLFGGVTSHVLKNMVVPVMMAH
jgi:nucleotide-binding universal stress UspA family protein